MTTTNTAAISKGLFYWTGSFWSTASNKAKRYSDEGSANSDRLHVGGVVTSILTGNRLTTRMSYKRWVADKFA